MRVIIAGSRNFTNYAYLARCLDQHKSTITAVLCGEAKGADYLGKLWAERNSIPVEHYAADWSKGKGAGFERNKLMASRADALIAFPMGRSPGTRHMIATVQDLCKCVYVYEGA